MKKFVFLLFIFAFSSISVFSQSAINAILKRIESHSKALTSLRGEISIAKSFDGQPEISKQGTFYFLPSQSYMLKIDIGKPKMESFTMIKDEFTFYQQNPSLIFLDESAVAYTGKIGNSQKNTFIIFSLLQNLSKKEIKSNYDISYIGEEKTAAEIPSWHLLLSPKSKDQLKKLEIWIDNDGMIGQSKLFENNGSSTMITLNNLKKNSIIQAKEFAADIPKNTPIVKN